MALDVLVQHQNIYGYLVIEYLSEVGLPLLNEEIYLTKKYGQYVFFAMIENGGLENNGSFMYKIKIQDAVNPYYFILTSKRNREIIYSNEPAKKIRIKLSNSKRSKPILYLYSNRKYQFELINELDLSKEEVEWLKK